MCGIVGVVRFDGTSVPEALLRSMADQLRHRGPDGEGYWTGGSVGFGHRRLSIIDVAGSPQPMSSADGRWCVTFNGEILNYQALRAASRWPFRTGGDTEVLLALHATEGEGAVDLLRGQFAYAIHDVVERRVWLVRDRLGILPLYYHVDDQALSFASEVKALAPALPRFEVDHDSLADFLTYRSVPAPSTMFRGVRKLPQGHVLRIGPDGPEQPRRYWAIPPPGRPTSPPSGAVDQVADALTRAVEANLVADVPVGAYLSGGVDSSLIVALVRRARGEAAVETFSAGFGDPRFDELAHARQVSRHLGTSHHEVVVSAQDFEDLWPKLTWHRDAPVSEPADIAVYRLAELAGRHVKVVLSGEGSDELFGGYPKHRFARLAAQADLLPARVRRPLLSAAQRALPAAATRPRILLRAMSAPTATDRLESWFSPFTSEEREALLGRADRRGQAAVDRASGDPLRQMLYVDCHAWLADNLLERGDRMTMAASVELRPPFLHQDVVELAFRLPSGVKVRKGRGKWVVKEVARRFLPAAIVDRPKVGFRVPLDVWFRQGLETMAWDLLLGSDSFVAAVTDRAALRSLLESHRRRRRNEDIRIWTLLGLEVWHRTFFGSGDPGPDGRTCRL